MLRDITIGQFIDTASPVHKLDPRTKILFLFAYLIMLFCVSSPLSYAVLTIFTLVVILLSHIPPKLIFKGMKPIFFILLFTALINLFVTPGKPFFEYSFPWFTMKISYAGIKSAVLMCIRLILLVTSSSMLTFSTSPMTLTDGIERLLRPFEIIHVPAHEIAMMMTIALRFIPTLAEETDKIIKAQTARGADFESGNIIRRTKAMIPLLVPLFVSAFRRADDLAEAMDARCYSGGRKRTRMKEIHFGRLDIISAVILIILAAFLFITEHLKFF